MSRRAHHQLDLFPGAPEATAPAPPSADEPETLLDPVEHWTTRLQDALQEADPEDGYLPLAECALRQCPGNPNLLVLAATAALLDGDHERALVLLKRFHKRAEWPGEHLLRAIALNLAGLRLAARTLLERHGLTDIVKAYPYFPGGRGQVHFLALQLDQIFEREERAPKGRKRPAAPAARNAPARARAAGERKRPAKEPAAELRPKEQPAGAAARAAPEPPAAPQPAPQPRPLALVDIEIPLTLECDLTPMLSALAAAPETDGLHYLLRERLDRLSLAQGFDELLCLPHLAGVEPLWHQIETVRKVLKQFRGRVLLADEVGLGKTIEAGMVLKEYALRGMADSALILTPASLVGQWREELATKFGLDLASTHDPLLREDPGAFWRQPRIIASIAAARRREHQEALSARPFDIVIVDEAHHLRDRTSAGWKLVDALNKRFLLLLSATPVQNDLVELYNLLTLLKPGIFKTLQEFRAAYMTPGKPRLPANPDSLRQLMKGAMVRNTRAVVALKLPRRHALTLKVDPSPEEADAYAALAGAARTLAAGGAGRQRLTLHHLLGAAGSSPAAASRAAERLAQKDGTGGGPWREVAQRFSAIGRSAKEAALLDLLARNRDEKKLVFVQARETLEHLAVRLAAAGIDLERFDGSMTGPQKDAAIAAFRERAGVLLCTQSGGEGRNIQFCNTLINYDVPWNPMAIEQRIGRLDRIGQSREVFVFNLVTRGTIEEKLLDLLEEKISMFELVVGEVGAILGTVEEEREFPELVLDAWLEETETGRNAAFLSLGERLDAARRQHQGAKELDERLFGEDFETG